MDEAQSTGAGTRRNEDIALDLMKFVAMTTGYGRTSGAGAGFQGTAAAAKPEPETLDRPAGQLQSEDATESCSPIY